MLLANALAVPAGARSWRRSSSCARCSGMLGELRYRAMLAVQSGDRVIEVAHRLGVSPQSLHSCMGSAARSSSGRASDRPGGSAFGCRPRFARPNTGRPELGSRTPTAPGERPARRSRTSLNASRARPRRPGRSSAVPTHRSRRGSQTGQHLPALVAAVADHQAAAIAAALGERRDIGIHLRGQRLGQHPPRTLADDLIDQRR
jgi:hypothetical protein